MPVAPFLMAMLIMISPRMALVVSPPASTTSTSPGRSMSSALWTMRLSLGRVRTVNADPEQLFPTVQRTDRGARAIYAVHVVANVRRHEVRVQLHHVPRGMLWWEDAEPDV